MLGSWFGWGTLFVADYVIVRMALHLALPTWCAVYGLEVGGGLVARDTFTGW